MDGRGVPKSQPTSSIAVTAAASPLATAAVAITWAAHAGHAPPIFAAPDVAASASGAPPPLHTPLFAPADAPTVRTW